MSSHLRPDPRQRAQRSSTIASVAGVGLVVFGVVLSIWQRSSQGVGEKSQVVSVGSVDGGVLNGIQHIVPSLAGILVAVIALAVLLLFKARRSQ